MEWNIFSFDFPSMFPLKLIVSTCCSTNLYSASLPGFFFLLCQNCPAQKLVSTWVKPTGCIFIRKGEIMQVWSWSLRQVKQATFCHSLCRHLSCLNCQTLTIRTKCGAKNKNQSLGLLCVDAIWHRRSSSKTVLRGSLVYLSLLHKLLSLWLVCEAKQPAAPHSG